MKKDYSMSFWKSLGNNHIMTLAGERQHQAVLHWLFKRAHSRSSEHPRKKIAAAQKAPGDEAPFLKQH